MSVMFMLVLASLFVATGFLLAFLWAVRSGQFEDRYTPSVRMLFDENRGESMKQEKTQTNEGEEKHGS
jgi:cbb3-type cytochrome oxidase maturation protein